jgi:cadmium resistance protein CadD (predicted permease)
MSQALSTLSVGIAAFVATNLDDLFLITLFFSEPNRNTVPIVLGEMTGILALSTISLTGYLATLALPMPWIGLMGFFPIAIGFKKLMETHRNSDSQLAHPKSTKSFFPPLSQWHSSPLLMEVIISESTPRFSPAAPGAKPLP